MLYKIIPTQNHGLWAFHDPNYNQIIYKYISILLLLYGAPCIIILMDFKKNVFLWNICLVPKQWEKGAFQKDEYKNFAMKTTYLAFPK